MAKKPDIFQNVICKWCGSRPVELVEKLYPKYPGYSITRRVEVLCRKCADKFVETECAGGSRRIPMKGDKLGEVRSFFESLAPGEIRYNLLEPIQKLIAPPTS